MFVINKLYQVKDWYWSVFPTKEAAREAFAKIKEQAELSWEVDSSLAQPWASLVVASRTQGIATRLFAGEFISPNRRFRVIETDGSFVKVAGDKPGWICADMNSGWVENSFECVG